MLCCCSFHKSLACLRKWPSTYTRILCLCASIFIQTPLVSWLILTHATHHLAAVGPVTATCCWVQEQLHIAVLWGAEGNPWISLTSTCRVEVVKSFILKLTHVGFVFRHCCHSILMCCKLYICLPSYPAIWADLNMDPHWIQWREELRNANKDEFTHLSKIQP